MKNLWLKKNPLLSMMFSGANAVSGAARGHLAKEMRRQQSNFVRQSTSSILDFWTGGVSSPKKSRRRKDS